MSKIVEGLGVIGACIVGILMAVAGMVIALKNKVLERFRGVEQSGSSMGS